VRGWIAVEFFVVVFGAFALVIVVVLAVGSAVAVFGFLCFWRGWFAVATVGTAGVDDGNDHVGHGVDEFEERRHFNVFGDCVGKLG
jgi:hypothetical protein